MDSVVNILRALSGFAWPAIALAVLCFFRTEISALLGRLTHVEMRGLVLSLGRDMDELQRRAALEQKPSSQRAVSSNSEVMTTDQILRLAQTDAKLALIQLTRALEIEQMMWSSALNVPMLPGLIAFAQALEKTDAAKYAPLVSLVKHYDELRTKVILTSGTGTRDLELITIDLGLKLFDLLQAERPRP